MTDTRRGSYSFPESRIILTHPEQPARWTKSATKLGLRLETIVAMNTWDLASTVCREGCLHSTGPLNSYHHIEMILLDQLAAAFVPAIDTPKWSFDYPKYVDLFCANEKFGGLTLRVENHPHAFCCRMKEEREKVRHEKLTLACCVGECEVVKKSYKKRSECRCPYRKFSS